MPPVPASPGVEPGDEQPTNTARHAKGKRIDLIATQFPPSPAPDHTSTFGAPETQEYKPGKSAQVSSAAAR
jgi:hypothetical protein